MTMEIRRFYIILSLVTFGACISLTLISQIAKVKVDTFTIIGLSFFLLFSIFIYHLGFIAAKSPNKYLFNNVVMGMIFLKLIFTVALVVIYDKKIAHVTIQHVASYLICYLFYTVYEVYYMSKLARWKV